jgi:hypothetical protein
MQRRSVVLPQPFGPRTETHSPGATRSDTSRKSATRPREQLRARTSSVLTGRAAP